MALVFLFTRNSLFIIYNLQEMSVNFVTSLMIKTVEYAENPF